MVLTLMALNMLGTLCHSWVSLTSMVPVTGTRATRVAEATAAASVDDDFPVPKLGLLNTRWLSKHKESPGPSCLVTWCLKSLGPLKKMFKSLASLMILGRLAGEST